MSKKDLYTKNFLKLIDDDLKDLHLYKSRWWFNIRDKQVGGLRLTEEGFEYLNDNEIKSYPVDLPKEIKISPQVLLWLDNYIDSPYYIDKHKIYVFKESVAFELYLFSGDIKKYGYAKAMNNRIENQKK